MSHLHNYDIAAIKPDGFDYMLGEFLSQRVWRRCIECGKREVFNVDSRLKVKEIGALYGGVENETFH